MNKLSYEVLKHLKSVVSETERIIAKEDCFYSWDGEIDLEVIVSGLECRCRALGLEPTFRITTLPYKGIHLVVGGYTAIFHEEEVDNVIANTLAIKGILSKDENQRLKDWLIKNYYEGCEWRYPGVERVV